MSRSTIITLVAAALFAGSIVSCDKSPTRPSPQGQTTTTTTPPITVRSILIDGPATVPPGQTAQYTAMGQMSDGTTRDLTSTVTWRSSDDDVLSISSAGTASTGKAGQAVIAAVSGGQRAALEVLVLAPGTFRLTGTVTEAGLPVADATVDLLDGSRAVMSTKTDVTGNYRLFGVAGDIEIRVTKDGYAVQVNRLSVSSNANSDFVLTQTARTNLAGTYQLILTAASQCVSLPQDAGVRTYAATIAQDGPRLSVALDGATVIGGSFTGRAEPGVVTFDIHGLVTSYYYRYYYVSGPLDFLEQLSPTSLLTVSGHVTATPSSREISGILNGVVAILASPLGRSPHVNTACNNRHQFALTRQ